ncbi:MAG: hypothetical protein U1E19_04620 [Rhodoblastus sp.]
MPIDPDAQNLLAMLKAAGRPPLHTLSPPEARAAYLAGRALLQPELPELDDVRDLAAPARMARSRCGSIAARVWPQVRRRH